MGYSTDFEGTIKIEPPLAAKDLKKIQKFLDDPTFPEGFYTRHCDFEITEDCDGIRWNGSEKSYDMDNILPLLIQKFFKPMGYKLNGVMLAQGESMEDRWRLVAKDNVVQRLAGHADHDPGEEVNETDLAVFLNSKCGSLSLDDRDDAAKAAAIILKNFIVVRK